MINTNYEQLYIKGEKSGSATITLVSEHPIIITVDEISTNLYGDVSYDINGIGTGNATVNFTYSNLYLNGETYNANVYVRAGSDTITIPVIINCSDTLIYSDVPNSTIIDVLEGIHINYNSLPLVNNARIILEDKSEININQYLLNQSINLSYNTLLSKFGIIDYDYLTVYNGMSEISHKLKKVTYELEYAGSHIKYCDFKKQEVVFKFKSLRNDTPYEPTISVQGDVTCSLSLDDDTYILTALVKENFGLKRALSIRVTQPESLKVLDFYIHQEAGIPTFYIIEGESFSLDDNEHKISVIIKSIINETSYLPTYSNETNIKIDSYKNLGYGEFLFELSVRENNGSLRKSSITFTQPHTNITIVVNIEQSARIFEPNCKFLVYENKSIYTNLNSASPTSYTTYVKTEYGDGTYTIDVPSLGQTTTIIDGNSIDLNLNIVNTRIPELNLQIKPNSSDVGRLMFCKCELKTLNELNLMLLNTEGMFFDSKLENIPELDLLNVSNARFMFGESNIKNIYIQNTYNIEDAKGMFSNSKVINVNNENGANLTLFACKDISYLFSGCTSLTNINELNITDDCTSITYAFENCTNLIELPLIDCRGVLDATGVVSGCTSLTNVGGFDGITVSLNLGDCPSLTHDSLMNIINHLGLTEDGVLTIHVNGLDLLTNDEIAIALIKGWTIEGYDRYYEILEGVYEYKEGYENRYLVNITDGVDISGIVIWDVDANTTIDWWFDVYKTGVSDEYHAEKYYSIYLDRDYVNFKIFYNGESTPTINLDEEGIPYLYKSLDLDVYNQCDLFFTNCKSVKKISKWNIRIMPEGASYALAGCENLMSIYNIPFWENPVNTLHDIVIFHMFDNCPLLTEITHVGHINVGLDFRCTNLTHDSLINVINSLVNLTDITTIRPYNLWMYLFLGDNVNKLTASELRNITDKYWIWDKPVPSEYELFFEGEYTGVTPFSVYEFCRFSDRCVQLDENRYTTIYGNDVWLVGAWNDGNEHYIGEIDSIDKGRYYDFNTIYNERRTLPFSRIKIYIKKDKLIKLHNISESFWYIANLEKVNYLNTQYVKNLSFCFAQDSRLTDVCLLDVGGVENMSYIFSHSYYVENIGGFKDLKVKTHLDASTKLTHESLMNVINNLATVDDTPTLVLGTENLNKLTTFEIKIATDKGWIVE